LLVIAYFLPSSLILSILVMEAIRSSKTSALTRSRQRHFPEYGILHSHRRENLKSCIAVAAYVVLDSLILSTLMMEPILPPKRRFLQEPSGVTSQKTAYYIVTAVKTSNLTHH
jgi:hypothetical protein